MGILRFFKMYFPVAIISGAGAFALSHEFLIAAILGITGIILLILCRKEITEVVILADNDKSPEGVKE